MAVRCVSAILIGVAGLAYAPSAQADFLEDFFHSVVRDTKRNNCWPQPFVRPDRYAARAPFALMVHNGWRRQNMLGDHHFEESTGNLNEAGRLKTRWIVTEAPEQHRTIFVHRAESSEETAARVDAVQELAVTLIGDTRQLPAVVESDIGDPGWPAERVDGIGRRFQASAPKPRLPALQTGAGGTD